MLPLSILRNSRHIGNEQVFLFSWKEQKEASRGEEDGLRKGIDRRYMLCWRRNNLNYAKWDRIEALMPFPSIYLFTPVPLASLYIFCPFATVITMGMYVFLVSEGNQWIKKTGIAISIQQNEYRLLFDPSSI